MTNAEKIQKMKPETLGKFLFKWMQKTNCTNCPAYKPGCAFDCERRMINWMTELVEPKGGKRG